MPDDLLSALHLNLESLSLDIWTFGVLLLQGLGTGGRALRLDAATKWGEWNAESTHI